MTTKVYLDTWLLRAYVSEEPEDRADAKRELSRIRTDIYKIIVPQIVIGEAVSVIMRDFDDPSIARLKLTNLYDELKNIMDMKTCLPSLNNDIFLCAQRLKGFESELTDTDSLILAHAILDPDSDRLLTYDKVLLNSKPIKDEEERMRNASGRTRRLKIVDGL